MDSLEEARKIYRLFKGKEGSQHIAGVVAIRGVIDICLADKPRRILEMGGGIGTITHTLLQFSDAHIDSYESNEWCRTQLTRNVGTPERLTVIPTYRLLPPSTDYDLLIVDGGTGGGGDKDDATATTVQLFVKYLDRVGKVLVEGTRADQRAFLRRALKDEYVFRPVRTSPNGDEKGSTVYLLRPVRSKVRWLNWLFWEFAERVHP